MEKGRDFQKKGKGKGKGQVGKDLPQRLRALKKDLAEKKLVGMRTIHHKKKEKRYRWKGRTPNRVGGRLRGPGAL